MEKPVHETTARHSAENELQPRVSHVYIWEPTTPSDGQSWYRLVSHG